jgi:hypothetical protein
MRINFALFYRIQHEFPEVYNRLCKDTVIYTNRLEDGSQIRFKVTEKSCQVLSEPKVNDSQILDIENGKQKFLSEARKQKLSLEEWSSRFDALISGELLSLPNGIAVRKGFALPKWPQLGTNFMDERAAALIAYEFMALALSELIYNEYFDDVREYLCEGKSTSKVSVEVGTSTAQEKEYDAFHAISIHPKKRSFSVRIEFFKYIIYTVHFHNVFYAGSDFVYLEHLGLRESLFAIARADAMNGRWLVEE